MALLRVIFCFLLFGGAATAQDLDGNPLTALQQAAVDRAITLAEQALAAIKPVPPATSTDYDNLLQAITDFKTARGGKKTTEKSRIRQKNLKKPQKARTTVEGVAGGHNVSTEDICVGGEAVLLDPGSVADVPNDASDAMLAALVGHEGYRLRQKSILPQDEDNWKKKHYLTHYKNTLSALKLHKIVLKQLLLVLIQDEKWLDAYYVLMRTIGVTTSIKELTAAMAAKQKEKDE